MDMLTAVDWDDGTVNPSCFVFTKQIDYIRYIFRSRQAIKRISFYTVLDQRPALGNFLKRLCVGNACLYAVRSYSMGGVLRRDCTANGFQGGLRCGHSGIAWPGLIRPLAGKRKHPCILRKQTGGKYLPRPLA